MKFLMACALAWSVTAGAQHLSAGRLLESQTVIPQPTFDLYGGVLGVYDYRVGQVFVPAGKIYQHERFDMTWRVQAGAQSYARNLILSTYGESDTAYAYGTVTLVQDSGHGLANGDYVRVQGPGTGPHIAHKTAVRGDPNQYGVWAYQVNLGPGAKAGFWVMSDNATIEGRGYDTVPNVMVIAEDLHISNAAIQRNAPAGASAAVLRVYNGGNIVAELMEDGTLRVKRIEIMP